MCAYLYTHIRIRAHVCACIHSCTHTHTQTHIYVCVYVHVYTCIRAHARPHLPLGLVPLRNQSRMVSSASTSWSYSVRTNSGKSFWILASS